MAQQLRPPALDSLGIIGALEQHATMLGPLDVDVRGRPPPLPAAVEVATYRIATEALTNIIRHSSATSADVCLELCGSRIRLLITDNGHPGSGPWVRGTGLTSMDERATELGGTFCAGPEVTGGRVEVTIPWSGPS
jgi:signal transduction histidine kinase